MNDADREIVDRLQHALEAIDIALMPSDQREADTKAVGGPVSPYGTDYDEQGVVQRVRTMVESQEKLLDWQQLAVLWLPECGTICQCQGEHYCDLKVLRREAAHNAKAEPV